MDRLVKQLITPFITEQVKATRVIAVYPGRFQPMGAHHAKTYKWLDKKFDDVYGKEYQKTFDECRNAKNVNYFEFLENKKVVEILKKMHIFAYPNIWHETSCVAAIESMAAGCEVVTTNLAALYETCTPFATFVNFDRNLENLEKRFSKILLNSVNNYWSDENQNKLKLQRETINTTYSWDVRSLEWKNFLNEARKK